VKRREFISLIGGAAAWPLAARAQQTAIPLVGFLGTSTANVTPQIGFRRGLAETGFVEGRNVAVEYRFSEGRYERLPELVADLLGRNVAVLFAAGGVQAALAAKPASATVPVVFANGSDPLRFGLVESLNRPGGNITGVSFFTATLEAKRLGLLSQLVPAGSAFGVLANPNNANAESQRKDIEQGGRILKGEKPADLPVVQSSKFEFVINLKTARALGIEVPLGLSNGADEIIA
jgi:putative ABC transport system substrate-binding protein